MNDPVVVGLVVVGTGFMLLSAVGLVRMPDVYTRLQVATKASSLGAGCLMLAVAAHFGELGVSVRAVLIIIFIFLTTPVSAHLIGRAAYLTGMPLWEGSGADALRGAYDPERGTLRGLPPEDIPVDDDEARRESAREALRPGQASGGDVPS